MTDIIKFYISLVTFGVIITLCAIIGISIWFTFWFVFIPIMFLADIWSMRK